MGRQPGMHDSTRLAPFSLTRMERQVLDLVLTGKTRPEVAETLFVSKRTIDFHLAHIYQKTQVRNQMELVIVAMNHDLHLLFHCADDGPLQEGGTTCVS